VTYTTVIQEVYFPYDVHDKLVSTVQEGRSVTWRKVSTGTLRRVALVRTAVSEELSASFIRMTRIGELGTTLAVNSNRRTLSS
jgi:hypothetical protein